MTQDPRLSQTEAWLSAATPSKPRRTPGEAAVAAAMAAYDAAMPDHDGDLATENISGPENISDNATQESPRPRRLPSDRRDPRRNGRRIMSKLSSILTPRRMAWTSGLAIAAILGVIAYRPIIEPIYPLPSADAIAMASPAYQPQPVIIAREEVARKAVQSAPPAPSPSPEAAPTGTVVLNAPLDAPDEAYLKGMADLQRDITLTQKENELGEMRVQSEQLQNEYEEKLRERRAAMEAPRIPPASAGRGANAGMSGALFGTTPSIPPAAAPPPSMPLAMMPPAVSPPSMPQAMMPPAVSPSAQGIVTTLPMTPALPLPSPPMPAPPVAMPAPAKPVIVSPLADSAPSLPITQDILSPTVPSAAVANTPTTSTTAGQSPVFQDSQFKPTATDPVATFSSDVDTAAYQLAKRMILQNNQLPPPDSVRVEEFVNAFHYDYPAPESAKSPFKPSVAVYPAPWNAEHLVMQVGIKGYAVPADQRPPANLVFLIDTSGSMQSPDKLPLVQASLRMLVDTLKPTDRVAIVTYAGSSGVALEPTLISNKEQIIAAINQLGAGGGTAGAEGINTAYALARQNFDEKAINRVILATDGDFNIGVSDSNDLGKLISDQKNSGVFLTGLGYGMGNYNDSTMQKLTQQGNGTAAYIGNLDDARHVLVDNLTANMMTIAKDVKFQIEFNPGQIREYRQIGYETRALQTQDFNNDAIDAGDVGAGHTVTVLFELIPSSAAPRIDDRRYAAAPAPANPDFNQELAFVKIRYKPIGQEKSELITRPVTADDRRAALTDLNDDQRLALAAAGFAQWLRGNPDSAGWGLGQIISLADAARGKDASGERSEFLSMLRAAQALRQRDGGYPR